MKRLFNLVFILLFITGCSKGTGEIALRIDMEKFPHSVDPQTTTEKESEQVLINTMSGLFKFLPDGSVVPDLAESFEVSDDEKTYTFTLKKGLMWEDETPLTSHDFKFALERDVSPKTNSPYSHRYMNIVNAREIKEGKTNEENLGVSIIDDRKFEIHLVSPDTSFLSLMAQSSSLPCNKEFFLSCKGKYGLSTENFLSNGPFSLSSKDENLLILKKNPKSLNPARQDKLYLCTERGDMTEAFINGRSEACIVPFKNLSMIQSFNYTPMYNKTAVLAVNPESACGSNEVLRKSIMQSALQDSLKEKLTEGLIPPQGIIPPMTMIDDINYRQSAGTAAFPQKCDMLTLKEEIQEEIKELPKEEFPKTKLITSSDDRDFSIASALQSLYSSGLSVYINIEPIEDVELQRRFTDGSYDLILLKLNAGQDKPSEYLRLFKDVPVSVDGLLMTVGEHIAEIPASMPKSLQSREILKIENALINENYVVPLYHSPTFFVTAANTEGIEFIPARQAVYFGNAKINKK